MAIKLQGYVFKDDGTAVSGASVQVYDSADGSTEGTATTTNSDGKWTYDDITADGLYDVQITSGGSVRRRKGADKSTFEELYIRNDTAATQSPLYVANATNAASVKVLDLSNKRATASVADNDEIYMSFNMQDSAGNADEFARITAIATDVTNDTEDGALVFYVADSDNNGNLQEGFRITSTTGGTVSATTTSASQFNNTITVGVDDTGYDVKFFGATASAYMLWDESEDDLILGGAARLVVPDGQLVLGSTAVSSTPAELNLMDGGSSIGTTAVSDGHGIVMNHGGTMAQTTVQTFAAYLDDEITGMPNLATVGTIGTGVWQGTAIASTYIAADAITGAKIADDAIGSEHIADDAVVSAAIADDAITNALIANNAVGLDELAGIARGKIIYGDASGNPAVLTAGNANEVLTSDGTDISWAAATTGDITGVTAGNGLSGGGTSGGVTLALDLSELTDTAIANGDYIVFTDTTDSNATVKGDLADVATLFAGTGLTASSSVIGVDASQTQITAVGTIATGVWNGTAIGAAYLPDASTSAQGVSELATSAEVTTGTDTGRTITPDALAGSVVFGTRYVQCIVFDFGTDIAEGNGKFFFHIPAGLNGMDLVEVHSEVITAGNGSTIDVQIHNATDGSDMLSTSLTIDNTETGSDTAATAAVINASEDDVATNDLIRIDVDGNGGDTTIAKGLIVTLGFRLP